MSGSRNEDSTWNSSRSRHDCICDHRSEEVSATISADDISRDDEIALDETADLQISPEQPISPPWKCPEIKVESMDGSGTDMGSKLPCEPEMAPWRPSIFRIAPLMGLAALTFTVCQILASYAVLASSNGAEVSSWQYQPNVYLAILTAISNKTLAFAAVQGAVVTFWLRILHGTTLAQIHRDWSYSFWVYKAICSGRNCSLVALACICASLVAVDGPLLQRASSVRSVIPDSNVAISVSISPEIPSYFTGLLFSTSAGYAQSQFSNQFLPVVREYVNKSPLRGMVSGCPGKCSATVRGPALAVEHCTSQSNFVNFSSPLSPSDRTTVKEGGTPHDRLLFEVSFKAMPGNPETLLFGTRIGSPQVEHTCAGPVVATICHLVSAIAEYEVIIEDGIVSFPDVPHSPKILAVANNTALTNRTISEHGLLGEWGQTRSTLAGIATAANYEFHTYLSAVPTSDGQTTSGAMTWFIFKHMPEYVTIQTDQLCDPGFSDPRQEIMGALNDLMFRTGAYAAANLDQSYLEAHIDEGVEAHYNVTGQRLSSINVFRSDFSYFAAAAAVQVFAVLVILTTFRGYWMLGRNASFSPLEVAKAFDAPILLDVASNQNGRHIAKVVEQERRVQYGVVKHYVHGEHPGEGQIGDKLVIAEETVVNKAVGQPVSAWEFYSTARPKVPRRRRWRNRTETDNEKGVTSHL